MNTDTELLHQGDNIVLTNEFNFSDSIFELTETEVAPLTGNFTTVANQINSKLKKYENLLRLGHINARSVPKHIHEIDKTLQETDLDALGVSEHFLSKNTPENIFQVPGYNFIHVDRDMQCRGGGGVYLSFF